MYICEKITRRWRSKNRRFLPHSMSFVCNKDFKRIVFSLGFACFKGDAWDRNNMEYVSNVLRDIRFDVGFLFWDFHLMLIAIPIKKI